MVGVIAGLLALGSAGAAVASPMLITSVARGVSLEIVEYADQVPSKGGVAPLSQESFATGAFMAGFPTVYETGDGSTLTIDPFQDSFVGPTRVDFGADTLLQFVEAPTGTPNVTTVDARSYIELIFTLASPEAFDLQFTPDAGCQENCTRFFLERTDVSATIFEGNGLVFNNADIFGPTQFGGLLAAGGYRFFAESRAFWGTTVREVPGGPLSIAFAVPEPSAFVLVALGLIGLARAGRDRSSS